jgi:hypothetical protein
MPTSEQRRQLRKPMRHNVWLHVEGAQPRTATVADISQSGARLDVPEATAIPDRFILLLSKNGSAQRLCRVVWRSETQLGVHFERAAGSSVRPARP